MENHTITFSGCTALWLWLAIITFLLSVIVGFMIYGFIKAKKVGDEATMFFKKAEQRLFQKGNSIYDDVKTTLFSNLPSRT